MRDLCGQGEVYHDPPLQVLIRLENDQEKSKKKFVLKGNLK